MTRENEYEIRQLDGTVKTMTSSQIAAATGISVGTIRRRLTEQGMRSMERLSISTEKAKIMGRRKFGRQNSAHFMEEKRIRAAEAAHPRKPWRDWKER